MHLCIRTRQKPKMEVNSKSPNFDEIVAAESLHPSAAPSQGQDGAREGEE